MKFSRLLTAIVISAFVVALPGRLTAAVQEVVTAFSGGIGSPARGGLAKGPDGFYWGATTAGGPLGQGAVFKVSPAGDWQLVLTFDDSVTGNRGLLPRAGLVDDGAGFLWGTTSAGGDRGSGTIFKIHAATGVLTTLHHCVNFLPNRGTEPSSALVHDGHGFLWGTLPTGGNGGNGALFKMEISSGKFFPVAEFTGDSGVVKGRGPYAGLTRGDGDYLWGCTVLGGVHGSGTLFKVHALTGAVTTVVEFRSSGGTTRGFYPTGELMWDPSGYLWGTTTYGGTSSKGTLFKLDAATGELQTIVDFTGSQAGAKGEEPDSRLEADGRGFLWGSTPRGGASSGTGTIFKVNMATGAFSTVVEFLANDGPVIGKRPTGGLVHTGGGMLLGTTAAGGGDPSTSGPGTIFRIDATTGQMTTLAEFGNAGPGDIGRTPVGLVGHRGLLWGVTRDGGRWAKGTVFKLDPATGIRSTLVEFTGRDGAFPGARPSHALRPDGNGNLWGTTQMGGTDDRGTLFKISESTGEFTSHIRFGAGGSPNGYFPSGPVLVDTSGMIWGNASSGGSGGGGTIYRFNPATTTFEAVVHFTGNGAINKGTGPSGSLHDDGAGVLWGITFAGGPGNRGTVFKLSKSTLVLTTLFTFTGASGAYRSEHPGGALIDDGAGFLWGTTTGRYINPETGWGTIYKIAKSTGQFTNVIDFSRNGATNKGSVPLGTLTADGQGNLWGVTEGGGPGDFGTVFRLATSTGQLTSVLLDTAGRTPQSEVVMLADGNFYGTATTGGPGGSGTVFRVRLGPTPVTQAATSVQATGAILNGTVNPNGLATNVRFEYGTDPALAGASLVGVIGVSNGAAPLSFSRPAGGLLPKTKYYYRITGQNAENSVRQNGAILSFTTPGNDAALSGLAFGGLTPAFEAETGRYDVTLAPETSTATLTATTRDPAAALSVGGTVALSGVPRSLDFPTGNTLVPVTVTAEDGVTTRTYTLSVTRLPETFLLTASNTPPLVTAGLVADGHDIDIELAAAPVPGRTLRVIDNTALPFVSGRFDNLAHGQEIVLEHDGRSYAYVANYYGGSGNDLTLHWKSNTVAVWGDNSYGQLANGNNTNGPVPALVTRRGVLAGKTVIAVAAGRLHCLALCSDGTVASWGDGFVGKLGDGRSEPSYDPVAVDRSGVLAGKTVVAVAAGEDHGLALCSDGTLAAWGSNAYGQLGDNRASGGQSPVPVAVDRGGLLAGKTVVAIAAGLNSNLALCSDGTLAAWGDNGAGQLGNPGVANNRVPSPVLQTGVLAGKQVIAISASSHCLALCADGAIASWGYNAQGQLGDNSTTNRGAPVLVRVAGALSGRTPVAVSAGDLHSLALGSDGTAIGWGGNGAGQLGNGSTVSSPPYGNLTPVAMNTGRLLGNRQIAAISAGQNFSLVTCTDGTPGACGVNSKGQLGNGTFFQNELPGPVSVSGLPGGSQMLAVTAGPRSTHGISIVPLQPPSAVTLAADVQGGRRAVVNGRVSTVGSDATVSFEWGETSAYGRTAAGIPPTATAGAGEVAVIAPLNFLQPGTTYHFRVRAENSAGVSYGEPLTFTTPSDNAFAASLAAAPAALVPGFNKLVFEYSATLPFGTDRIAVAVGTEDPRATVTVDGAAATAPVTVELPVGTKAIEVIVTAEDRTTTRTYVLHVTRLPAEFVYETGGEVPVTSPRFVASGIPVSFVLNYAPAPGTVLTVARSAGLEFISGRFSNLAQGQLVVLDHGGTSYRFTANYYGGSGNDLVLQWADSSLHGWGANANGQLGAGDGGKAPWSVPAALPAMTEPRLLATATGYLHSLALAADGAVLAWGYNVHGQLGDGSKQSRPDPSPVVSSGALAGKRVIAVAAGAFHSLALCDDGTVAAWGYNNHGQLGNGTTTTSTVPVAVERAGGVLAGKTVVSIAAGAYHSLALCSDGSVFAWGFNETGALGNNTTTNSSVPVSVRFQIGALRATAISAGQYHNLAIREGVSIVAWGYNPHGQLGTGNTTQQNRATSVPLPAGLAGKSPRSVAAGGSHSLALFEDGTLAAWGLGTSGQLGDGAGSTRLSPVAVLAGGGLSGKSPASLAAGDVHSLVGFTDGSTATWGGNLRGQLGTGSASSSPVPVLLSGSSFMAAGTGPTSSHVLALQPLPASPGIAAAAGGTDPGTIAAWRMLHFGHAGNSGEAANLQDPDHDGVSNLMEFAFGMDPLDPDSNLLPAAELSGAHLVIEFTERPGLEGVIFKASSTRDLRTWTPVTDEGVKPQHRFRLPTGEDRGFMRLEVEER